MPPVPISRSASASSGLASVSASHSGSSASRLLPVSSSPSERLSLGVSCSDSVVFPSSWHPGGDYLIRFPVQNVGQSMLRLIYQLPRTAFFWLAFPEPLLIAPGMAKSIDIHFRPVKEREYADEIRFSVSRPGQPEGQFSIPIVAPLPTFQVSLDRDVVEFGRIAVGEVSRAEIMIENTGEVPSDFEWDVAEPFKLTEQEQKSGIIKPGEKIRVEFQVMPALAELLDGSARFYSSGIGQSIRLRAVAELPVFQLTELTGPESALEEVACQLLDFGSVLSGAKAERRLVLRNLSSVRCSYQLKQLKTVDFSVSLPPVFAFKPNKGYLEPNSSQLLTVQYSPLVSGTSSCERYLIRSPGGNAVEFSCLGLAVGPKVTADIEVLQFPDQRVGSSAALQIKLFNASSVAADYQFDWPENSSFSFSPSRGSIAAQLPTTITVKFKPRQPINYYAPVYLLIRNSQPLRFHLIGSGFNEIVRPASLAFHHVQQAAIREKAGLRKLSPQQLRKEIARGAVKQLSKEEIDLAWSELQSSDFSNASERLFRSRAGEFDPPAIGSAAESAAAAGFVEGSIDTNFLNFSSDPAEPQRFRIFNHSSAKVVACWDLHPNPANSSSLPSHNIPFVIEPCQADILPNSSVEFTASFVPSTAPANRYFHHRPVCFLFYKCHRNFRLVEEASFGPPQSVAIDLFAHSLDPAMPHFISNARLIVPQPRVHPRSLGGSSTLLQLPPTSSHPSSSSFASLMLVNPDDTPAQFHFPEFSSPAAYQLGPQQKFRVAPFAGLIPPKSFQLLSVQFVPKPVSSRSEHSQSDDGDATADLSDHRLPFILNYGQSSLSLDCVAFCYRADLQFSFSRQLYFKPTSIGLSARSEFELINLSRIPSVFKFDSSAAGELLEFDPPQGAIAGNAKKLVRVRFKPLESREYALKVPLVYREFYIDEHRYLLSFQSFEQLKRGRELILQDGGQRRRGSIGSQSPGLSIDFSPESFLRSSSAGRLDFRCRGSASYGEMSVDRRSVEFGELSPERTSRKMFEIRNAGDSAVRFRMELADEGGSLPLSQAGLQFSHMGGVIESRSSLPVWISFQPQRSGEFRGTVRVFREFESDLRDRLAAQAGEALECWAVSLAGVCSVPRVQFASARLELSSDRDSEAMTHRASSALEHRDLLQALQLTAVNSALLAPPPSLRLSPKCSELSGQLAAAHLQFPFRFPSGVKSRSAEPEVALLYLELHNPASLACRWSIHFPDEMLSVEPERWFEDGDPTRVERLETAIGDARLFQIEPRKGKLEAGERCTVLVSYSYRWVGIHRYPIVLSVADGGSAVSIMLQGETLNEPRPLFETPQLNRSLHQLTTDREMLERVHSGPSAPSSALLQSFDPQLSPSTLSSASVTLLSVCDLPVFEFPLSPLLSSPDAAQSPIRSFTLYNPFPRPLEYMIDCSAIDSLTHDYSGLPIFRCLTQRGVASALSSTKLQFQFSPIEEKQSHAQIAIRSRFQPLNEQSDDTDWFVQPAILCGRGSTSSLLAPFDLRLSPSPSLELFGGLLDFSLEVLEYSSIPFGSSSVRQLRISNPHSSLPIEFSFAPRPSSLCHWVEGEAADSLTEAILVDEPGHDLRQPLLAVFPRRGLLAPLETRSIYVRIRAAFQAAILDEEIVCFARIAENEAMQQQQTDRAAEDPAEVIIASTSQNPSQLARRRPVNSSQTAVLIKAGDSAESKDYESQDSQFVHRSLAPAAREPRSDSLRAARALPLAVQSLAERTFGVPQLPDGAAQQFQSTLEQLHRSLDSQFHHELDSIQSIRSSLIARRVQFRAIRLIAILGGAGERETRKLGRAPAKPEFPTGKQELQPAVGALTSILSDLINQERSTGSRQDEFAARTALLPVYEHIKAHGGAAIAQHNPAEQSTSSAADPLLQRFLSAALVQSTMQLLDQANR